METVQSRRLSDYEMMNMELIQNAIQKRVIGGAKRFLILPMGIWGKRAKEILETEFHITPEACFDNYTFNGQQVYPVNLIKEIYRPDMAVILTAQHENTRVQLFRQITPFILESSLEVVSLYSNSEQKSIFDCADKVQLDFLCTGFHKCGTTSLHAALQQNKRIFLPDIKETFFVTSMTVSSHSKLKQCYEESGKNGGKIVKGGIEPTYAEYAESVCRYFGADLKILFCIRNPVEALKSSFKMAMREVGDEGFYFIKKYKRICPEMIEEYIEKNYQRFIYIDFIGLYERYFERKNIEIVITEEMIQSPQSQMDHIQDFIGLPEEFRIKYEKFPFENKGDVVYKNMGCAYINHALNQLRMQTQDAGLYAEIEKMRKQILNITTSHFKDDYKDIWKSTYNYYADSIHEVEERLGRTLKGIWY